MFDRLQFSGYGPFTIPKKNAWVIVGSGPTAELVNNMVGSGTGIISLNAELPGIPYSTVHIVGHYEYYLQCIHDLAKTEILFFADPMHVGYRCVSVSAMNLLDFDYFQRHYPRKLRFFEKEPDQNKLLERSHTLYCRDTLASTAVHLLALNGVKSAYYCGIDGHELSLQKGRSKMFEEAYRVREVNARVDPSQEKRYDEELKNFLAFAKKQKVSLTPLSNLISQKESSHAMLQTR